MSWSGNVAMQAYVSTDKILGPTYLFLKLAYLLPGLVPAKN